MVCTPQTHNRSGNAGQYSQNVEHQNHIPSQSVCSVERQQRNRAQSRRVEPAHDAGHHEVAIGIAVNVATAIHDRFDRNARSDERCCDLVPNINPRAKPLTDGRELVSYLKDAALKVYAVERAVAVTRRHGSNYGVRFTRND